MTDKTIEELKKERQKVLEEIEKKKLVKEIRQLKHQGKIDVAKKVGKGIGKGVGNIFIPQPPAKLSKNVELICTGCGREVSTNRADWSKQPCLQCGSFFKKA